MSTLYNVIIERVHGGEVDFRVITIHPDAGPPSAAATFPMNLLIDLWSLLDRGYVSLIDGCTLTKEEAVALARDPAYAPRLAALRVLAFGRDEPCSAEDIREVERLLHAGEPILLRGMTVAGWASNADDHRVFVPGDHAEFAAALVPLVEHHGLDEQQNQHVYDDWPDADDPDLPSARVWLRLTDPTLLGFVRRGWSFETASHY